VLGVVLLAATATAPVAVASASGASARPRLAAASALVRVGGPAHVPSSARPDGALRPGTPLQLGVALRPRDPLGLSSYAAAVSTPGSPDYHRYLTPRSFAARYGPTHAAVRSVETALRRAGLKVGSPSANGLMLPVNGSVGRVESAFHTRLAAYRLAGGARGWAAATVPLLPAGVAGAVQAVLGLDELATPHSMLERAPTSARRAAAGRTTASTVTPRVATPQAATAVPQACPAASQAAVQGGGWTDAQIAKAYGLSALYAQGDLGAGQTIALYELEPFASGDIATFDRCYFGASHAAQVQTVPVDGFSLSGTGSGEALLDIEDISALAPAAHVLVYEAPNTTFGGLDEYNAIVSQDRASIVSSSWGECESALQVAAPGAQQVENYLFEEAAAQGQTVFSAAGDDGSDDCAGTPFGTTNPAQPLLSVDDPASQPYVVGVGGTSLHSDTQPATETVWNDGAKWGAGGGGISNTWASPAWQADSGVAGVQPGANRQVPDVSASADEWRGITVYSSFFSGSSASTAPHPGGITPRAAAPTAPPGWTTLGGTSSAAPTWAAIAAEIAASSACSAASVPTVGGVPDLGFIGAELYSVAANPTSYAASFSDVVRGNNDVFGLGLGYPATPGYDLATGLGTPVVTDATDTGGLDASLCAVAGSGPSTPARPTVSGLSPSFGPTSGGGTVTVTGTNFPAGDPSAVHVEFGNAAASVTAVPDAQTLTVSLPAATVAPGASSFTGAGPVDVAVTVSGAAGASTSVPATSSVFNYVQENGAGATVPSVTGVGPSGGNVAGGNTVVVYGQGFTTAGPPTVTFGGVAATGVNVVSAFELMATAPQATAATACATGLGFVPSAACQVQVVVTNANGSSATATILPALSGAIVFDAKAVIEPTPETEVTPASTEYDYAPTPVIASIAPDPGDASGQTPVVITGTGFSLNTFAWVNFGPPSTASSEQVQLLYISPTRIEIAPPSPSGSGGPRSIPLKGGVSVQTSGGLSNVVPFSYGGTPIVRSISALGGPATGGTVLHIRGSGLSSVRGIVFEGELTPEGGTAAAASTSYAITGQTDSTLTVVTPAALPGPVDVLPCSATACARANPTVDTFVYFDPGAPSLAAVTPRHGPAHGDTEVVLFGDNLDGAVSVRFGGASSDHFVAVSGVPSSDPYVLGVRSAPGRAGGTVRVSVVTRSGRTGVLAAGTFRYTASGPSAPRHLRAAVHGSHAHLSWVAPMSDGGSPVTEYEAIASATGVAPAGVQIGPGARSVDFDHLVAGRAYTFRLVADNAVSGRGVWATAGPRAVAFAADGYRLATSAGVVTGYGSLPALGGIGGGPLASPVAAITGTADGGGYWLVTSDGSVYAFGDANNYGFDHPAFPVVAIEATPSSDGYWVLTRNGGVSAFGRAKAYGSLAGRRAAVAGGVVGLAPDLAGAGYWIVNGHGRVFGFGDAKSYGSVGASGARVVGIAATPGGKGYWVLGATGAVYAFGDARGYGGVRPGHLAGRAVSLTATPDGHGYWIATSTGAVYAFGDAHYAGGAAPTGATYVGLATT